MKERSKLGLAGVALGVVLGAACPHDDDDAREPLPISLYDEDGSIVCVGQDQVAENAANRVQLDSLLAADPDVDTAKANHLRRLLDGQLALADSINAANGCPAIR